MLAPSTPAFRRRLLTVFGVAVLVSVVHYVDSVVAHDAYPRSGTLPNPSAFVIGAAWFAFTAFGIAGVREFTRRGPTPRAALLLAAYSGSGLIGVLHYAVPDAINMPWWRQAHIVADILCGVLIFAMALAMAQAPRRAALRGG